MNPKRSYFHYHPVLFNKLVLFIMLLTAIIGYLLIAGTYRAHYMDTAWTMSFAWNWLRHGESTDVVFRHPDHTVTLLFGRTMHLLYGSLLDIFGWSAKNARAISTTIVFLTAALWYHIFRRFSMHRFHALTAAVMFLFMRKTLIGAHLARPDALSLFLSTTALLLFMRKHLLLSGFAVMVAVETHPLGVTSLFYILPSAWWLRHELFSGGFPDKRETLHFLAGIGAGTIYYLGFHLGDISGDSVAELFSNARSFNGYTAPYYGYLHRHFVNHIPELIILCFCAVLTAVDGFRRQKPIALVMLLSIVLSSLFIGRPNGFYALAAMPAIVFFQASATRPFHITLPLTAVFAVLFVLHIHNHLTVFRKYNPANSALQIHTTLPDDGLPVIGLSDFWFQFRDRTQRRFIPAAWQNDLKKYMPERCYFIATPFWKSRKPAYRNMESFVRKRYKLTQILSETPSDHTIKVYVCEKKYGQRK